MQPGKWEISEGAGEWRPSTWLHMCVGNEDNDEAGEQWSEIPPWDTSSTRALTLGGPSHSHARLIWWSFILLVSEVKICAALRWRFERVLSYKFLSVPKLLLVFLQM